MTFLTFTKKYRLTNNKLTWVNRPDRLSRLSGPSYTDDRTGHREWARNGKLHRIDGPAIIFSSGTTYRTDGYAVIGSNGVGYCLYEHGKLIKQ